MVDVDDVLMTHVNKSRRLEFGLVVEVEIRLAGDSAVGYELETIVGCGLELVGGSELMNVVEDSEVMIVVGGIGRRMEP